jgi:hypothetical protein
VIRKARTDEDRLSSVRLPISVKFKARAPREAGINRKKVN